MMLTIKASFSAKKSSKTQQKRKCLKPRKQRGLKALTQVDNFGEGLRIVQDNLNSKNFYAFNPSFD